MPFRSHLTQIMQNYFDATDRRTRESPVSLETQLLNMAAIELEDLALRVSRETEQTLQTVPTNIDSGGVYYAGKVPVSLLTGVGQTTFNNVTSKLGTTTRPLTLYDDSLPVPARVEFDGSSITPIADPIMFTMIGSGDDRTQIYTVQHVVPGQLPIPNKLTFWVDQIGENQINVSLTVTGETFPQPAWVAERRKTTESVRITSEGVGYTRNRWALVDKITVRGLPIGVRLRCWSIGFNLPAEPDLARPYTTPEDRDVLHSRYWLISNSDKLLKEMFLVGEFTGLQEINSYLLSSTMTDVAVEPNTNGMYVASNNTLYYIDRREVMPDVTTTGLSAEPLYGLQLEVDPTKNGPIRYITLSAIPYANSNVLVQYRYTINGIHSILPSGALGPANTGWRIGLPESVTIPLLTTGDYVFKLEMQDQSGTLTYDVLPYRNGTFAPIASIDVSALVDKIVGLAFDSYGQLWMWNGTLAVPIVIHYDGYNLDADTGTIFVTDPCDSLQVS